MKVCFTSSERGLSSPAGPSKVPVRMQLFTSLVLSWQFSRPHTLSKRKRSHGPWTNRSDRHKHVDKLEAGRQRMKARSVVKTSQILCCFLSDFVNTRLQKASMPLKMKESVTYVSYYTILILFPIECGQRKI